MPLPHFLDGDPSEPNRSFNDAILKVRWAEQNINNLFIQTERFVKSQQDTGLIDRTNTGAIRVNQGFVPPEIALIAGDVIHNLRSALDCCWMGMNRSINKDSPKLTLPFARDFNSFIGSFDKTAVKKAIPDIRRVMDVIRPYESGNEILWFGNQIDNWNKHNMLPVMAQHTYIANAAFTTGDSRRVELKDISITGDGAMPFMGWSQSGGFSPFNLDADADVRLDIVVHAGEPEKKRTLIPFVAALLKDTKEAVDAFVEAFAREDMFIVPWGK